MTSQSRPDPILLTLFANRFMSVAEVMGRLLQQPSISTNIKERLDFSCALFAFDGDLVGNVPFISIHLGSKSFAVKYQIKLHGKNLKDGDILMTNSPHALLIRAICLLGVLVQSTRAKDGGRRAVAAEVAFREEFNLFVVGVPGDGAGGAYSTRRGTRQAEIDGLYDGSHAERLRENS